MPDHVHNAPLMGPLVYRRRRSYRDCQTGHAIRVPGCDWVGAFIHVEDQDVFPWQRVQCDISLNERPYYFVTLSSTRYSTNTVVSGILRGTNRNEVGLWINFATLWLVRQRRPAET